MLCPLGNPFFLFIITDHLKMRSFVTKAPENFHTTLPQSMLFLNGMRLITQKLKGGGTGLLLLWEFKDLKFQSCRNIYSSTYLLSTEAQQCEFTYTELSSVLPT